MRADRALSSEGNGDRDGNDAVCGVFSFGSVGRVVVEVAILSLQPLKRVSLNLMKE